MAVATLPSPLYGLYRTRDHLSALTITVVFAIFAASTIALLQRDSAIAARIGRRGTTGPRRKVRLPVPTAAGTLAAFSANGLFAGLSGLFLATTLHHPSHALAGAALFLLFTCGVVSQLATLRASRVLALGTASLLASLVLLVVSVRLSPPNLAMFLIAGALIGAGSGASSKGRPESCSRQARQKAALR